MDADVRARTEGARQKEEYERNKNAAILGGVLGAIGGAVLLALGIWIWVSINRKRNKSSAVPVQQ